ncbi:unnamed protein product, partial [Symbiodinium microadriaticum]
MWGPIPVVSHKASVLKRLETLRSDRCEIEIQRINNIRGKLEVSFLTKRDRALRECQRIHGAHLKGVRPPLASLLALQQHHSRPLYKELRMGGKRGWGRGGGNGYASSSWNDKQGKWAYWKGTWSPRHRAEEERYDQVQLRMEASEQDPRDAGGGKTAFLLAVQKAVTLARRHDVKLRKLTEEQDSRRKLWKQYVEDIKRKFAKQKREFEADIQKLEADKISTLEAGQMAAAQVKAIIASGPTLSLQSDHWADEDARPVAEVESCLSLIGFDGSDLTDVELWRRLKLAFKCVCAATPRLRLTAEYYRAYLQTSDDWEDSLKCRLLDALEWIAHTDLTEWLVVSPETDGPAWNTFRDGHLILNFLEAFESLLTRETFLGDLIRLSLRLWGKGLPACLLFSSDFAATFAPLLEIEALEQGADAQGCFLRNRW